MTIPALRQSTYEQMACPDSYVAQQIDGQRLPENIHSERGTEIHHVMGEYIQHCTMNKRSMDWRYFDQEAEYVGLDAGIILNGIRETYIVDYEHAYSTEIKLMLDEDLQPTIIDEDGLEWPEPFPGVEYSGKPAAHAGTLDVASFISETYGLIQDFKSHFKPFAPDTYQSMLYPFMLMQHLPKLEEVEFELIFVRFRNARRSRFIKREELPEIARQITQAKARQIHFHILADEPGRPNVKALPHSGCVYCPKMVTMTCPWKTFNPATAVTIEERIKFAVFAGKAMTANTQVLNEISVAQGPLSYTDANGNIHTSGHFPKESKYYPAVQTLAALVDWNEASASGGDPTLFKGLRIGSSQLKPKLKAKKRAILDRHLNGSPEEGTEGLAVRETKTSFQIRTSDGEPVDDGAPKWGEEDTTSSDNDW